jgi:hypothetical protein
VCSKKDKSAARFCSREWRETQMRLIAFFPCLQTSDAAREGGDVHAKHKPSTLTSVMPVHAHLSCAFSYMAPAQRDSQAGLFLLVDDFPVCACGRGFRSHDAGAARRANEGIRA